MGLTLSVGLLAKTIAKAAGVLAEPSTTVGHDMVPMIGW